MAYPLSCDKPGQIGSWKGVIDVASHLKSVTYTMATLEASDTGPVFRLHCNRNAFLVYLVIDWS